MIGRDRERSGRASEVSAHLVDRPRDAISAHARALERGVVRVRDRERREVLPRVERGQIAHEHRERPRVHDDVVHRDDEQVIAIVHHQEPRAEERSGSQIKGRARFDRRVAQRGVEPLAGVATARPRHGEGERELVVDHRDRVIAFGSERGAERLVPRRELRERVAEPRLVDRALEAQRDRHVVRRVARIELGQEPEPLLRERERERRAAIDARDGVERAFALRRGSQRRERGDRLRLEERLEREIHAERAPEPAHHLRAEERVAAELEEAVVGAHLGDRDAQHLGEDRRDRLLFGAARRHRDAARARAAFGLGEPAPIDLARRGERQRVEQHERLRDHVLGQARAEVRAQIRDRRRRVRALRHHVRDEPLVLAVLAFAAHDRDRLTHAFECAERDLDLTELDAEAAHLDLRVRAAQKLEPAVGQPPHEIACFVEPLAPPTLTAERIGEEPLGRERGPLEVTARERDAAEEQLATRADGRR